MRGLWSSPMPHGVLDASVFLRLYYTIGLRSVSSHGHSPTSLVSRVFMEFDDARLCGWPPVSSYPMRSDCVQRSDLRSPVWPRAEAGPLYG